MFTQRSWVPSKSDHERGGKNIVQRWWPRRRSLNGVISAPLSGHFGTGGPAANCTLPQGEKNWQDTRGAWATFNSVTEISQFREPRLNIFFRMCDQVSSLQRFEVFPKQNSNPSRSDAVSEMEMGRLVWVCICIAFASGMGLHWATVLINCSGSGLPHLSTAMFL